MESDRVVLLPPSMDLIDKVHEAILESQNELSVYLPWVQGALADPEKNMKDAIEKYESFQSELRHFIFDKHSGQVVGAAGLMIIDKDVPFFEIGYWVRTSYAGKGYISESVKLLENHAFHKLDAKRIEIRAAEQNSKSRTVAERLGYQLDATFMNDHRLPSGELSNTVVYSKCG